MLRLATRWLPYGLLPSAPEAGRSEPVLLELRLPAGEADWMSAFREETVETVHEWSANIVLNRFAAQALYWHQQASRHPRAQRTEADLTRDELRQWVAHTRSLADRMPFSGPAPDLMRYAAARLERVLDLPARFFVRWPASLGTKADAQHRASINLWAMDRLVRAINEIEPAYASVRQHAESNTATKFVKVTLAQFWPAMFGVDADGRCAGTPPAFADAEEAQKRIDRLDESIKPDLRDVLMVALLREVLLDDGYRWPDLTTEYDTSDPPATHTK